MPVRLNKALADLGLCSRRKADELIAAGRVRVNGVVATVGMQVDPAQDAIRVDEETVEQLEKDRIVIVLNKPAGYVTSNERRTDDPIVLELLGVFSERVFPVGRLDKLSRGLLLLTNDGALAYRLTHPKFEKEKEYLVRVAGVVEEEHLRRIRKGMVILGEKTKPAQAKKLGNSVMQIVLTEGKNRQIRRILRKLGLAVTDLQRVRVGSLRLGDLAEGEWRPLSDEEVAALMAETPDMKKTEPGNRIGR